MKKILFFIFIALCSKLFAINITITGCDGRKKVKSVNNEIEKLFLVQEIPDIVSIEGLDQLSKLKYIQISFSDLSNLNSSTWQSMKEIEILTIDYCSIADFKFLDYLPHLKVLSFTEGISIADSSIIDLHNNGSLEFFEIHINSLVSFPKLVNYTNSLKYVIFNFDVENITEIYMKEDIDLYIKEKYQYLSNNKNFIDDSKYLSLIEQYHI